MKKMTIAITALLIFVPLSMLLYKTQVLQLSLIPQMVEDVWNFHMSVRPRGEQKTFSFPIPESGPGVKITDERIRSKDLEVYVDKSTDSILATWTSSEPIKRKLIFTARVDIKKLSYKNIPKDFTESYPKELQPYLRVPELIQEDATPENLAQALLNLVNDKDAVIQLEETFRKLHQTLRQNTAQKAAATILPYLPA